MGSFDQTPRAITGGIKGLSQQTVKTDQNGRSLTDPPQKVAESQGKTILAWWKIQNAGPFNIPGLKQPWIKPKRLFQQPKTFIPTI